MRSTEIQFMDNAPKLTRKEAALLELLERNPGRYFSRAYLLNKIWGYEPEIRTRTLDAHVSRLRQKLRGRRDVTIHAVMGHGYFLQRNGASSMETSVGTSLSPAVAEDSDQLKQESALPLGDEGPFQDDIEDEAPGWGVTMT